MAQEVNLGAVQLLANKIKVGATNVAAAYVGATQVFPPASAGVAKFGAAVSGRTIGTTLTVSCETGGSNRYLLVILKHFIFGQTTNHITGVTYNGDAMTHLGTVAITDGGFGIYYTSMYGLVNPDSGTHDIVVTSDAADNEMGLVAERLTGVDQSTPTTTLRSIVFPAFNGHQGIGCEGYANGMSFGVANFIDLAQGSETFTEAPEGIDEMPAFTAAGVLTAGSAVTSRTPAAPTGTRFPGDLEIAECMIESNATIGVSGSGWNLLTQIDRSTAQAQAIAWRRYDGSNVDPVFSWSGAVDGHAWRNVFRGAKVSGTPLLALGTEGTGTTSTHTSTGGNTTQPNSNAIYIDSCMANTALAQPTGWTELRDLGSATGPCRVAMGFKLLAAAGASGDISVTGGNAGWIQRQLEMLANNVTQTSEANALYNDGGVDYNMHVSSQAGDSYNVFGWNVDASNAYQGTMVMAVGIKPV